MITKKLKNVEFVWNDKENFFLIGKNRLTRFEALSLSRFVIRIYGRYFYTKKYEKNN